MDGWMDDDYDDDDDNNNNNDDDDDDDNNNNNNNNNNVKNEGVLQSIKEDRKILHTVKINL